MRSSPAAWMAPAALTLLLAAWPARADFIPWTYSWSNNPADILADNPIGGGRISLSSESSHQVVGDSDIVATNIRTFSSAPPSAPDTFTQKSYMLALGLKDDNSGQSGITIFTGVFNGTLTAESSNITNKFTSPTTQVLVLGGNTYTITLNAYTPPGPVGSTN
ncbi:MAG: hypothetical protein ACRD36_08400, partial [Candidatus Acidiferrum sp.]